MSKFDGRPIIVSGGASGIGRALVAHLAAEGALFLSPTSGYITGQTISVSGGLTMHG